MSAEARSERLYLGYFTVDLDIVWEIVERELPPLSEKIAALLAGS